MGAALVTGASSGIGRETALEMGQRGYHVIAAGRSESRTMPVVELIRSGGGSAEFLELDLASLHSTRAAARALQRQDRPPDVLVANAGVGGVRGITADGFEIHFGVNHLGHFALTDVLATSMPDGSRVVVVSSAVHRRASSLDFARAVGKTRTLLGIEEYAVSKLANVLFARELARRHGHLRTYSVHPGAADTTIFPWWLKPFIRSRLISPAEAAGRVLWCALADEVAEESGLYYRDRTAVEPSELAQDDDLAVRLWERSAEWAG